MLVDDSLSLMRLSLDRRPSCGMPLNFDDNEDFLILFHFFLHRQYINIIYNHLSTNHSSKRLKSILNVIHYNHQTYLDYKCDNANIWNGQLLFSSLHNKIKVKVKVKVVWRYYETTGSGANPGLYEDSPQVVINPVAAASTPCHACGHLQSHKTTLLASTKLYCLVTEAQGHKEFAKDSCTAVSDWESNTWSKNDKSIIVLLQYKSLMCEEAWAGIANSMLRWHKPFRKINDGVIYRRQTGRTSTDVQVDLLPLSWTSCHCPLPGFFQWQ